jgi:hypothetical protein
MMDDVSLLKTCLTVTGGFEENTMNYDAVAGNFDGQGISVGVFQWNAGQGTLQTLLQNIAAKNSGGWTWVQSFFKSDIHAFAMMNGPDAVEFAKDHYIMNGSTGVAPAAVACWKNLLGQPDSIAVQQDMAIKGPLSRAKAFVLQYTPSFVDRVRPYAFFFDLVNQDGGMSKKVNGAWATIPAVAPSGATSWSAALALASQKDSLCYSEWAPILNNGDPLSKYLMHYAWQRAQWVNPLYVWDTVSRRGTIACRVGRVHATPINLTQTLD